MSAAMQSTLNISFDIRGGLLIRQVHHWAALLFVASIGLHMLRIFFTGAFRKPRELNWVIGFVLFILAMAEGFTGYSLPDDLLSGNGLRIIDGMVKGFPFVGTWISFLLFGGEFPGTDRRAASTRCTSCCCPRGARLHRAAPRARGHQQAHAVRRPRPHERQRRRLPDHAGVRGEGRRLLLHHLRRDHADRVVVPDQPDLDLRALRPLPRLRGNPARLVHRLRRRRAAPARRPDSMCRSSTTPSRSDHPAGGGPRPVHRGRRWLPLHRGVDHRRQARAPHRGPSAQRPRPAPRSVPPA